MKSSIKNIIKKLPFSEKNKKFLTRLLIPSWLYFLKTTTSPLSNSYGFDRGKAADRYYIEDFLNKNKKDIHGHCLETREDDYTQKFGKQNVIKSDVLDIDPNNKKANITDDLRKLKTIKDNTYDCIILTQTLQLIDDVDSVLLQCYRVLKKGGILLVTIPSLSRVDRVAGLKNDYWRFTEAGARYLFEKQFKSEELQIESRGNARIGIYFYAGLAEEEIKMKVYGDDDPFFPMIITIRAIKS